MRSSFSLGVVAIGAVALSATASWACGDKFVVLGRGVRSAMTRASAHPASILIYGDRDSHMQAAEKEYRIAETLKLAGHKPLVVENREQLDEALTSRRYDLVLADLSDAARLDQGLRAASSGVVVIPVMYKPTSAELTAAEKQYGCLLKAPTKDDDLLSVVDEAMQGRAKGSAPTCRKPK
jgi:ABC-type amino acid transport substrate-binding protein